jgi:hypothetical protein
MTSLAGVPALPPSSRPSSTSSEAVASVFEAPSA